MTELELQQEKASEAQLNNLSQTIIGQTAWGQFYGLMRGAASMGQGAIPHQVCLSADGKEVKVYNKDAGKVVAAFLKPTHEYVTMYVAQKNYPMAIASVFGLAGQLQSVKDQKKAKCVTVIPTEVIAAETRRVARQAAKIEQEKQNAVVATKTKYLQYFAITFLIILVLVLLFFALRIPKNGN